LFSIRRRARSLPASIGRGHGQRKECRFALELYAEGATLATGKTPDDHRRDDRQAKLACDLPAATGQSRRPFEADLGFCRLRLTHYEFKGGATQIVQRTICKSRHGCSRRDRTTSRTTVANLTVDDVQPPTVSIVRIRRLARGEWVGGEQTVNYTASDNVGVQRATQ
jgi:hypothetical protein